jgi:hypothetical protein
MVRLNPSVVTLIGVLLCCLFAKIGASARATGEAAQPSAVTEVGGASRR